MTERILTPWDRQYYTLEPKEQRMLIITEYVAPPVPSTLYDWMASVDGEEDFPIGRGPTECEALRDLCEQLALKLLES